MKRSASVISPSAAAPPPTSRTEGEYAGARRAVTLAHLKFVDLVRTGDELVFRYKSREFSAHVTVDGTLAAARHAAHCKTSKQDATLSYYRILSNFTNDAVTAYCADSEDDAESRDTCRTNPNPYAGDVPSPDPWLTCSAGMHVCGIGRAAKR